MAEGDYAYDNLKHNIATYLILKLVNRANSQVAFLFESLWNSWREFEKNKDIDDFKLNQQYIIPREIHISARNHRFSIE